MLRNLFAWCLALALGLVAIVACGWNPGQPGSHSRLTIRVVGNELVSADGTPIRLLGVVRSGTEYACIQGSGLIDGPTDRRAVAATASWGVNVVRIPLNEDCWLGINGVPTRYSGAQYRSAIRAYVIHLHQAGLYVILDLHWNAPGKVQSTGQQPMADLDHASAFWSSVARAFKADPAVLFDLYNEPLGISWRCWREGCALPSGWTTAGMQALVDAVRSTGARQPVIAAGLSSGNDLSSWLRFRPYDPAHQLVAGFHAYSFLVCATVACWTRDVAPVARSVPVIATEIGEVDCSHSFINRFMNWADSAGVSYLGWGWDTSGCGAPALISSWAGQPTAYGQGLRTHLIKLRSGADAADHAKRGFERSGGGCRRNCVPPLGHVPVSSEPHTFAKVHLRAVAQLTRGLVDGVPVVCAEDLHAQPGHDRLRLITGGFRKVFGDDARGIEHGIRDVDPRRARADLTGNRLQELLLGERAVVTDVEGLADGMPVV